MVASREGFQSLKVCSLLQIVGSRWKCVDIGLLQPCFRNGNNQRRFLSNRIPGGPLKKKHGLELSWHLRELGFESIEHQLLYYKRIMIYFLVFNGKICWG